MKIYVGNLSKDVSDEDLKNAFSPYGQLESSVIIKDKFSGESKGFGFVEVQSVAEGQKAIRELNGKELKGKEIVVNEARPKTDNRNDRRGGGGPSRRW